jgi:hypothetical protein
VLASWTGQLPSNPTGWQFLVKIATPTNVYTGERIEWFVDGTLVHADTRNLAFEACSGSSCDAEISWRMPSNAITDCSTVEVRVTTTTAARGNGFRSLNVTMN